MGGAINEYGTSKIENVCIDKVNKTIYYRW